MYRFLLRFGTHQRGIAALEFGICAPFLIAGMAAAFDYGYAMWARSCLANAVEQGAYYAILTGTGVTAAAIESVVQNATPLRGIPTPTVSGLNYFCPSGTPLALGTSGTASTTCTALGAPDGYYITINAHYTLPATWGPMPSVIYETVTVRLQ